MLGRLRKLAWGVGVGVGAGVSWLAIFWAVLMSVLAACFWSPPLPLHGAARVMCMLSNSAGVGRKAQNRAGQHATGNPVGCVNTAQWPLVISHGNDCCMTQHAPQASKATEHDVAA